MEVMEMKRYYKYFSWLLISVMFTLNLGAKAEALTGEEIIKKSHAIFYGAGNTMRAEIEMKLINRAGKVRMRRLTMLRKNTGKEEQKYYIYFHAPEDVRGMVFMVWKYPGRDDDRWLFMPALNLVRRIAAKDSQSSFVGSDFTYEDVSGRDIVADNYKLLKEEPCMGRTCYVVESIPKVRTRYKKKISWIDKKTFLPIREEYYDHQGKVYKIFKALEIKDVNGIPTIIKRVMENTRRKHRTEVVFNDVRYGINLPDRLFTERYLRRPPGWIR